ncbi:MAG TPA: hypothetical protein PLN26_00665 [Acidobacteriota bacterium]|nr:hypothetical protein [Acidobacteriota bacterium]HQG91041.1 hypothetical protein [Acidobacteriota bacterium]HQK89477.1 hypothetical protein [Acidobacteriota bacterium]
MPDDDERVNGAIDAVGFHKTTDPEAIAELQDMQRMYERIADAIRDRKNVPFTRVLQNARAKAAEAAAAAATGPDAESTDATDADDAATDTTG